MTVLNRGVQFVWNDESTGSNGSSTYAVIGAQTNVAVHISVDGATTIKVEAAYSANHSSGINYQPGNADAHQYHVYSNGAFEPVEITFATAGQASFDISPYTPNFLRLTSTSDVTATAAIEVVG